MKLIGMKGGNCINVNKYEAQSKQKLDENRVYEDDEDE